jgi:hypothetical protein
MNELIGLTQLLYSCWILSSPEGGGKETIPAGGGVLDYALRDAVRRGAFPEWARRQLHFVSGDAGLSCPELASIERLATGMKFTSDPNPSYTRTTVIVGEPLARRCLAKLNIPDAQAKQWGITLREAVAAAEEKLRLAQPGRVT